MSLNIIEEHCLKFLLIDKQIIWCRICVVFLHYMTSKAEDIDRHHEAKTITTSSSIDILETKNLLQFATA